MDLCYHYHVRRDCRYGDKCRFIHEFQFDPLATYYTCTASSRRKLYDARKTLGITPPPAPLALPPLQRVEIKAKPAPQQGPKQIIVFEVESVETDHDGYCSGADRFFEHREIRVIRSTEPTIPERELTEHCCCGCKIKNTILHRFVGFETVDDYTTKQKAIVLFDLVPLELIRLVWTFMPTTNYSERDVPRDRDPSF